MEPDTTLDFSPASADFDFDGAARCGRPTAAGPCALGRGHPTGSFLPGDDGHMAYAPPWQSITTEHRLIMSTNQEGPAVTAPEDAPGQHEEPTRPRKSCDTCGGTGYVKTLNDLLRESADLLGDAGDAVVANFYHRLLDQETGAAPHLAPLFPADIVTAARGDETSEGAMQRELLFGALEALAKWYDPDDDAAMERLENALRAYGRRHSAFRRPDGSVRGATLQEYAVVQGVLFDTLHAAAGEAWRPEYDAAWIEAYDFAAVTMMHEQHRNPQQFARTPRELSQVPVRRGSAND